MGNVLGTAGNNFQGSNQFSVTITASGAAAAVTAFALIRGTGGGSSDALPTGITLSGDYDDYTELQNAFRDTGINVTEIVLESATTAHFQGTRKIERYERQMNNVAGQKETIYLNKYKTDSGGGVSTTAIIADKPFFITPRTVLNLDVLQSANITVTFIYDFAEDMKPIAGRA